jgi:hypothetical protein
MKNSKTYVWVSIAGATFFLGACATPCVDDGLLQSDCPVNETAGGTESADGSGSASLSNSNSNSDSQSGSATASDTDPTQGSGGETEGGCPLLDVLLEPQPATVLLLVDQSSSMLEDFGGMDRWDAVRATLFDPQDGVVPQLEAEIRFGLVLYSSENGGPQCPLLQETAVNYDNADAMAMLFDAADPIDDTPTGDSLAAVAATLVEDPEPGKKMIVLATDGEPDTCDEPDPQNGQAAAVEAARNAYDAGIETAIISVGSDVSDRHLQDLANAGAGAQGGADAPFYQALDHGALLTAFQQVLSGPRDCRFQLDMEAVSDAQGCTLWVNGEEIERNSADGWELDGKQAVELLGEACEAIQEGEVTVSMNCQCGSAG